MRLFALTVFLILAVGCGAPTVYPVPDVPSDATALVLQDDELPRTVYASVWGAFAAAGWEVLSHDSDAYRMRVRAPDADALVEIVVEPEMEYGRAVAATAVATSEAPGALEAAAAVLAKIPGDLAVR